MLFRLSHSAVLSFGVECLGSIFYPDAIYLDQLLTNSHWVLCNTLRYLTIGRYPFFRHPFFFLSHNRSFMRSYKAFSKKQKTEATSCHKPFYLLRYKAVSSIKNKLTFRRNISPPSSGLKNIYIYNLFNRNWVLARCQSYNNKIQQTSNTHFTK
jgi:hypothetical protein